MGENPERVSCPRCCGPGRVGRYSRSFSCEGWSVDLRFRDFGIRRVRNCSTAVGLVEWGIVEGGSATVLLCMV